MPNQQGVQRSRPLLRPRGKNVTPCDAIPALLFLGCFTVDSPMILVVKLAYRISDLDNVRTFGCTVVDARDILLFAGL